MFYGRTGFYWKVYVMDGHVLHKSISIRDYVLLVNVRYGCIYITRMYGLGIIGRHVFLDAISNVSTFLMGSHG